MKKLAAIVLLGLSTTFGYADDPLKIDPKDQMFIGRSIYSQELPIPIIYESYDTDGNGIEDVRIIYQIDQNGYTRLIAEFVDNNRDGLFEDSEKHFFIDLKEEYGESKGGKDMNLPKQQFNFS